MKKIKIAAIILVFIIASCSPTKNLTNTMSTQPDFGLRVFSYYLTPNKKYIVLKEHDEIVIATKILSSYNTETLINALSIAYLQLTPSQQNYVTHAFRNTRSLPYRFQEAIVVAVKTGDEVNQDPSMNSLKNLIIVAYGNMTQEEIQSRYYYGLTQYEQKVFKQRWNDSVNWFNLQKEQYELTQKEQNEQQAESNQSGSKFWDTLGKIVLGVVGGYLAYRASTYNSNIDFQLNGLRMQNTRMEWQINNIQNNLRRLAY